MTDHRPEAMVVAAQIVVTPRAMCVAPVHRSLFRVFRARSARGPQGPSSHFRLALVGLLLALPSPGHAQDSASGTPSSDSDPTTTPKAPAAPPASASPPPKAADEPRPPSAEPPGGPEQQPTTDSRTTAKPESIRSSGAAGTTASAPDEAANAPSTEDSAAPAEETASQAARTEATEPEASKKQHAPKTNGDANDRAAENDESDGRDESNNQGPAEKLRGHFVLGLGPSLVVPFGEVSRGVPLSELAQAGAGGVLDLGVGVSHDVVVGAYGEVAALAEADQCRGCSPSSWGAGLFVRYHLVQGLRFDPWASYGLGFRTLTLTQTDNEAAREYAGIEWLRLSFGGDWYPTSNFGFGPFIQFGAASMFDRPEDEVDGGVNWRWQLGLRLVVDVPGR